MVSAILSIIAFLLPLVDDYIKSNKTRTYAKDKRDFDKYLVNGNANSISRMFEQLHKPFSSSGNSGRPSNNKTA